MESASGGTCWSLKRNCSMAPMQLVAWFGALGFVSLVVASYFWMQGVRMVLPFASLELLVLGAALVLHARHAGDCERIELDSARLVVERHCGGRVERAEFWAAWVKVELQADGQPVVALSGQGQRIAVGRFVRPAVRQQLASELNAALRQSRLAGSQAGAQRL